MSATETEAAAAEVREQRSSTLAGALVAALADLTVIGKGRTYALLAALGIATGEDDDGEAGAKAAAAPKPLTVNQAKNYLVSLIGKDEAVQAWEWWRVLSDDPPEFPAEVDALAKRWQERPMDEETS